MYVKLGVEGAGSLSSMDTISLQFLLQIIELKAVYSCSTIVGLHSYESRYSESVRKVQSSNSGGKAA
jgi:hypothetical protein